VEIKVRVHTRSSKKEVVRKSLSEYEVYLHSLPKDNEANIELIELLSKHFNVSKSNVKIIKGEKSKYKVIRLLTPEE
jgi:uncharacterized protein (TIGR00251 family)